MDKRINVDIDKAMKASGKFFSKAGKEIMAYKDEILVIISVSGIVDSIKTHFEKDVVEKACKKGSVKYKSITRKHEAEIKVLKDKAEKRAQAEQRVQQLEHTVQEILEERAGNE